MTALVSRFALAGFVLALAAAAVTTIGTGALGGSLGSLFGFHSRLAPPSQPVALAGDVQPVVAAFTNASAVRTHPALGRQRHHQRVGVPPHRPANHAPSPAAPAPAPVTPAPVPVVPSPPPPSPPQGGAVSNAERTIRQVTAPVAPAQPVVDQVTQTADKTCSLIGGCP